MPLRQKVEFWRGAHSSIPIDPLPGRLLVEEDTGNVFLDVDISSRKQLTDTDKLSRSGDSTSSYLQFNGANNAYIKISGGAVEGAEATAEAWRTWLSVMSSTEIANIYASKQYVENNYLSKASATELYLTRADAAATYLTQTDAAMTYVKIQDLIWNNVN